MKKINIIAITITAFLMLAFNVNAQIVGRVEAADAKKLTITSEYGTFKY